MSTHPVDPWGDDREERQAEREQAAREAEAKRSDLEVAILLTFSTDQGRRVLAWIEESCYAFRSTFAAVKGSPSVDQLATARNEGRRTVWIDVRNAMHRAHMGRTTPAPTTRPSTSQEV